MLGNCRKLDFHLRILAEKASMVSFAYLHIIADNILYLRDHS